jgi:hypothetical protein
MSFPFNFNGRSVKNIIAGTVITTIGGAVGGLTHGLYNKKENLLECAKTGAKYCAVSGLALGVACVSNNNRNCTIIDNTLLTGITIGATVGAMVNATVNTTINAVTKCTNITNECNISLLDSVLVGSYLGLNIASCALICSANKHYKW